MHVTHISALVERFVIVTDTTRPFRFVLSARDSDYALPNKLVQSAAAVGRGGTAKHCVHNNFASLLLFLMAWAHYKMNLFPALVNAAT